MRETIHGGNDGGVQPGGKLASHGSETDPPEVPKTAGLGEGRQGLTDSGGSDTGTDDKTKAGLGED
jgi:hypothetical protein